MIGVEAAPMIPFDFLGGSVSPAKFTTRCGLILPWKSSGMAVTIGHTALEHEQVRDGAQEREDFLLALRMG